MTVNLLISEFRAWAGATPRVFSAPGRLNVIGEHTDYNDGFVMPCAIDFRTSVAIRSRSDRRIRIRSAELCEEFTIDLDAPAIDDASAWMRYPAGIAVILERLGFPLCGADILTSTDIPIGAGLSSSAAFEIAIAMALSAVSGHSPEAWTLARIGQAAEHEFAGVRSGIMDQFASVFGRSGHALFLDCRSLEWKPVSLAGARFVVCNTRVKHELADGEYNRRRAECESAAAELGTATLRDATLSTIAEIEISETLRRRARHVVTENQRVLAAVECMNSGDFVTLGRLMNESHESLRTDFEVSCEELDVMAEIVRSQPGILGARMMGGGFGGCVVGLYDSELAEDFAENVRAVYTGHTGIDPAVYFCKSVNGASEILLD